MENSPQAQKKQGDGTLDLDELVSNIEKSVLLLGQTHVTTMYHRRINVVANIVGNKKKAQEIVRSEESSFHGGRDLFGPGFLKALVKKAKSNKDGAVVRQQFGSGAKRGSKPFRDFTLPVQISNQF